LKGVLISTPIQQRHSTREKKKKPGGSMHPAQGYSNRCDVSTSSIEQLLLTIGKDLNWPCSFNII
jgi:hypothetical protein